MKKNWNFQFCSGNQIKLVAMFQVRILFILKIVHLYQRNEKTKNFLVDWFSQEPETRWACFYWLMQSRKSTTHSFDLITAFKWRFMLETIIPKWVIQLSFSPDTVHESWFHHLLWTQMKMFDVYHFRKGNAYLMTRYCVPIGSKTKIWKKMKKNIFFFIQEGNEWHAKIHLCSLHGWM